MFPSPHLSDLERDFYLFDDFYDFDKFVCGHCRYGHLNVSICFFHFVDLGNCHFPGISDFVVIYTTGFVP